MEDREESVQHFLDLIKRSRRGKFKIYIGMIAGVGKSYRMLQEAHEMLATGVLRPFTTTSSRPTLSRFNWRYTVSSTAFCAAADCKINKAPNTEKNVFRFIPFFYF